MGSGINVNFSTAALSIIKSRPLGNPPIEYRKVEDAIVSNPNKGGALSSINIGHIAGSLLTLLGLGSGYVAMNGDSGFQKARYGFSSIFNLALGAVFLGIGFLGKDPALEDMKKLFSEQVVKKSTDAKEDGLKIDINFDDYVQSNQHMGEYESLFSELNHKGTTINLMGEVGTGKTFGVACLAGEIARRTGKPVEHWEVDKEATGSDFGDQLSKVPLFGGIVVGETRVQKLERIVANALVEVKKHIGPDGTPQKYIVISVDEVANWLGKPENKLDAWDFNADDPSKRSEISNALGVLYNKILNENGKGIVLALMSNAINKDVSKHLKDRFIVNQEFRNPDEELRAKYYFKIVNKTLKDNGITFQLDQNECNEIAKIGTSNLLLDVFGKEEAVYDDGYSRAKTSTQRVEGYVPHEYQSGGVETEMKSYNLFNFRNVKLQVLTPLINQFKANQNLTKEEFISEMKSKLQDIVKSKLVTERTWQSDLDRRVGHRRT